MADTNGHRIWAATGSFGVWGGIRSLLGGVRDPGREGALSAGRRTEKKEKAEQNYSPFMMRVVVMEQWICMVLGITCIVSGIVGIAMNPSQNDVAASLHWSKSIYVPLLRITAAICLALGVVLVRLGWRGSTRTGETL
jgi:hypothetical protein